MRRLGKGAAVIVGCLALAACASLSPTKRVLAGTYRWGDDPDNAQFLCLSTDGSYTLTERSSMAAGEKVKPFSVLHLTGQWRISEGRVILEDSDKTYFPTGRLTLLVVERKSAKSELLPVMGAGWTPERGYVRQ
ncbi:hypothetical protein DB345_04975 [Spartobacteria bacterium LR76]|nr:hypothetical protein DB345_04975 [Spartobacteria bacterium LR76]